MRAAVRGPMLRCGTRRSVIQAHPPPPRVPGLVKPSRATAAATVTKIGLYCIAYLGIWHQGRALTMTEVIDRAASLGFDGIEIDGKRPHGNPLDWDARMRHEVRELCAARGLEIVGVAA